MEKDGIRKIFYIKKFTNAKFSQLPLIGQEIVD
jgi:hypothetical protein